MTPIMRALLACVVSLVRSRAALHLGILALRHQLGGINDRPDGCTCGRAIEFSGRGWRGAGPDNERS